MGDITLTGKIKRLFGGGYAGVIILDNGEQHRFAGNKLAREGERVTFIGSFIDDPKWGEQFKIKDMSMQEDASEQGIFGFLDGLPNIGPVRARTIFRTFGKETFNVIEHTPQMLSKAPGITPRMCEEIHNAYLEKKSSRDLLIFLKSLEISDGRIGKILKLYGAKAPEIIRHNPYRMIQDIEGFGFKTVDDIARKSGIKDSDPERIRAGIIHALREGQVEGHCFANRPKFIPHVCREVLYIAAGPVESELDYMAKEHLGIVEENGRIYLEAVHNAEKQVARILLNRLNPENLLTVAEEDSFFEPESKPEPEKKNIFEGGLELPW